MSQVAGIPMEIQQQSAAVVIGRLQEEVGQWKRRAEAAEALVAELRARVAALEGTNTELRKEIAQLKREGKRSAGPYSKNKRKHPRKKSGRKKGQGKFGGLTEAPASPDTTQVDVPPPDKCDCGGTLDFVGYEEASKTDPPENVRPHVTKFRVPVCRCRDCGATVRGKHPDLAPDQVGATAHRYGDRMMALGHVLHYGMGIPQRKVPAVVELFAGVGPTQSALNQDAVRRSEEDLKADYKALRESMKDQAVGHTDATGWKVDGEPAQMMVFANGETTVYDIQDHYRNDEIREVFPKDYKGTLVGDGAKAFNANELNDVKQQKCIFHGLKLIREAHEKQKGSEREFGELLKGMLQEGLALWHGYHEGKTSEYQTKVSDLDQRITEHLRERPLDNEDNQRLLKFFGEHHRKGNLTRFLHDPRVPPTNNLAELELRFLITARKVSQCSKNGRGANAQKVLGSLIRTEKRKLDKEQRQSPKPYTDQRTSQADERERKESKADAPSKLRTKLSQPVVKQGDASSPHPAGLLDRVTDLFQTAKYRWRTANAVIARMFGPARSRSP